MSSTTQNGGVTFGSPYRDHSAKPTTGKPIIVVERNGQFVTHHRFRDMKEATTWLSKK